MWIFYYDQHPIYASNALLTHIKCPKNQELPGGGNVSKSNLLNLSMRIFYYAQHQYRPRMHFWHASNVQKPRASGGSAPWTPARGFASGPPARGPKAGPWTPPVKGFALTRSRCAQSAHMVHFTISSLLSIQYVPPTFKIGSAPLNIHRSIAKLGN